MLKTVASLFFSTKCLIQVEGEEGSFTLSDYAGAQDGIDEPALSNAGPVVDSDGTAFAPSAHTELVTSANVAPLSFTTEEVSAITLKIVGSCSLEINSLRKPFGLLSAAQVLAVVEAAHAVEESNGENGSLEAWTKQMNGCLNLEVEGMPEPAVEIHKTISNNVAALEGWLETKKALEKSDEWKEMVEQQAAITTNGVAVMTEKMAAYVKFTRNTVKSFLKTKQELHKAHKVLEAEMAARKAYNQLEVDENSPALESAIAAELEAARAYLAAQAAQLAAQAARVELEQVKMNIDEKRRVLVDDNFELCHKINGENEVANVNLQVKLSQFKI